MAEIKRIGYVRVRSNQLKILVEEMEKNPNLNGNKISSNYTTQQRQKDWEVLRNKLHNSGGAIKGIKCWQKCWADKKCDVKKRYRNLKAKLKTGSRISTEEKLSPLEERILILSGLDVEDRSIIDEDKEKSEIEPVLHFMLGADYCQASSACENTSLGSNKENSDITIVESFSLAEFPQQEPFRSEHHQPTNQTSQSSKEASSQKNLKDAICESTRVTTDPVIIKPDGAKKLSEGEKGIAAALMRCAEALQKQNELKEKELEIRRRKLNLQEREFEMKEKEMTTALMLCANALQKQNHLKETELEMRKRSLDLQEKELERKKRKADEIFSKCGNGEC